MMICIKLTKIIKELNPELNQEALELNQVLALNQEVLVLKEEFVGMQKLIKPSHGLCFIEHWSDFCF